MRLKFLFFNVIILLLQICLEAFPHVPAYVTTPSDRIDQYCLLAESCMHDTIPVCGQNMDKKRTFLDICDMLEFVCDTMQLYNHIDDEVGCPVPRP